MLLSSDMHTQHGTHHGHAGIRIRTVGLAHSQFWERREFGSGGSRGGGAGQLRGIILAGDHSVW